MSANQRLVLIPQIQHERKYQPIRSWLSISEYRMRENISQSDVGSHCPNTAQKVSIISFCSCRYFNESEMTVCEILSIYQIIPMHCLI